MMRTWLQRDKSCRTLCALARSVKGDCFRVRPAARRGPTAARNTTARIHDHTTYGRIGRHASESARGKDQRMAHVANVVRQDLAQSRSTPATSLAKVSKSFASRKFL